jgi:hypothetical protein
MTFNFSQRNFLTKGEAVGYFTFRALHERKCPAIVGYFANLP